MNNRTRNTGSDVVELHDVTFDGPAGPLDYVSDVEFRGVIRAAGRGGDSVGTVAVRLQVDGQRTQVLTDLAQTGDLAALEAAIEGLQRAYVCLSELLGDHALAGRCLAWGSWGRCASQHGHPGGHDFPDGHPL